LRGKLRASAAARHFDVPNGLAIGQVAARKRIPLRLSSDFWQTVITASRTREVAALEMPMCCERCPFGPACRAADVSATTIEARLMAAGRVLMALPWAGCFPTGFRSLWPDAANGVPRSVRQPPSSREISAMDEAYRWIAFIGDPDERRLVLMRSLVLPDSAFGTPRHVWTWNRLRRVTGLHPDTLMVRHGRGIDRIVRALNGRARCPAPSSRGARHGDDVSGDGRLFGSTAAIRMLPVWLMDRAANGDRVRIPGGG
jgi:hypothetical protein